MSPKSAFILYHPADEELSTLICEAYDAGALARNEIKKFICNSCSFDWAATLKDYQLMRGKTINEVAVPQPDQFKNFIYDKATGLILVNFMAGYHTIMMAHFEALVRSPGWGDDGKETHWGYNDFSADALNESEELADSWVLEKRGFFLSSVGKERRLVVACDYPWTIEEKSLFGHMPRDEITP